MRSLDDFAPLPVARTFEKAPGTLVETSEWMDPASSLAWMYLGSSRHLLEITSTFGLLPSEDWIEAEPKVIEPIPACLEQVLDFSFVKFPIVSFGKEREISAYSVSVGGPSTYLQAQSFLRLGDIRAPGLAAGNQSRETEIALGRR
jgi:hypothetical protein